jgi:hypothetical protein
VFHGLARGAIPGIFRRKIVGLESLSKMSDEEYKRLSPQDLMAYNRQMPETDYSKPYLHKAYPKAKYQLRELPGGVRRLVSVEVASAEAEAKLVGDWRDNPTAWGIVTHPESDPVARETGYSFDVNDPIAPQVAHTPQPDGVPPGEPVPQDDPDNAPVREPGDDDEGSGATARPARRR